MTSDDCHTIIGDIEKFDEKKTELVEPSDEIEYPEGGVTAWLALLGSFLAQFTSFGYLNSFGVYEDYYVRTYLPNYTASQISWIGSTQLFIVLSMSMLSGRAFDAGYFYHVIIAGSLLFSFSLFMLSLTQPGQFAPIFLAHGIANSIAIGLIYTPSLAVVSQYFRRRRAWTMGISAAGSAVGGTLHPIMLNQLFHNGENGFKIGTRASAGMNLCVLLIAVLLMKPRWPPKKQDNNLLTNVKVFLREPAYVFTGLGTAPALLGMYFPLTFLQLYAVKRGINPQLAFYSLAILNGSSAFGRIIPNLVVHKFGNLNVLIVCVMSSVIMIFSMLAVNSTAGIVIFCVIYGFLVGAYVGLLGPLFANLAKNQSEIGARIGICFAFTGIGGLVGNPIAGALLSSSYDWWKAILFAGLAVSLAAASFTTARHFLSKERGTMIV
ncbi:hypothetical protein M378DRAFT_75791 [Amanita muscaria Koide BX008]|uniref:Major facilitator superfamily (MFS) profile domain-containing protein n=1 Tax=Amanita muscaria (strain Koide BX008) TaxID=946122 RepID=A0A0C2SS46_AMAMK|nr:hypothetical protein M378DRAFT_75791 [Amanita muscaria Koide BX008]